MKVIATWHSKTATKICPCVGETLREHSQWGRDLFQRIIIICTFFRKKKLAWGGGRRHNPMSSLRGLAYLSTGVSMAEVLRLCGVHKTIITRLKKKRVKPQYWAGWVASRPGKQTNSPGAGRRRVVFDFFEKSKNLCQWQPPMLGERGRKSRWFKESVVHWTGPEVIYFYIFNRANGTVCHSIARFFRWKKYTLIG